MRVLIVHSHPETVSFNASMMREAVKTLAEVGHEVRVSDLYEMGFDPVSDRRNFKTVADPERLDQQRRGDADSPAHDLRFCRRRGSLALSRDATNVRACSMNARSLGETCFRSGK